MRTSCRITLVLISCFWQNLDPLIWSSFSSVVRRMALWDPCNLWSSERRNEHCGSQYWCPECQRPQKVTLISTLLCPPMISVSRNSSCCPCSALIPCHFCFYLLPFFSFPFPCLLPKFSWTARSTLWLKIREMIFFLICYEGDAQEAEGRGWVAWDPSIQGAEIWGEGKSSEHEWSSVVNVWRYRRTKKWK